jgi:hypothetical protein
LPARIERRNVPFSKPLASAWNGRRAFNVEMLEVAGGRFWKPYGAATRSSQASAPRSNRTSPPESTQTSTNIVRRSILRTPKLREFAAALGPAYMHVSSTCANTTYFAESDRRHR